MKVKELYRILELAIHDGHENAPIYFDTDARKFDYHMVKIGSACCQEEANGLDTWIILCEEN